MTGITTDGGYAETMIAEARALALIPDALKSEDAAPGMCAGHNNTPLPFREWAGLATLACSLHEKWACVHGGDWWGPPTKRTWRRNSWSAHLHRRQGTRRGGSTAKSSEAQMSSLRPRQAGLLQSVSLLPGLNNSGQTFPRLSESQVIRHPSQLGVPLIFGGWSVVVQSHRKSDRDSRHA